MSFRDAALHLPEIWAQHAHQRANHPALIVGERSWTWSQIGVAMDDIAGALHAAGLRPGDSVAYLAPPGFEALSLTMGIIAAGLVAVPLSGMLTPEQLEAQLLDCAARVFCAIGAYEAWSIRLPSHCARLTYDEINGKRFAAAEVAYVASAPACILYSSGTTGTPKGIVHSLEARLSMATALALGFRIDATASVLVATPIASNATWMMLMPTLLTGGTFVWLPGFEAEAWGTAAAAAHVTHAFAVPLMLQRILASGAPKLPSLRVLVSAGSTLAPQMKLRLIEHFGAVLFELYGCTEGIGTILPPEAPPAKLTSVGQPLATNAFMILGDDDHPAAPGVPGEIIGRGASLMSGYHGRPEETARVVWTDSRGRDWLRTGDIGRLDGDGYLTIVDRKKDMIVSGGLNVYPADIEAVMAAHPEVAEVAVVGVPHEEWGETPFAFVVPANSQADTDAIALWTNARVAKHQRISGVAVRDSLPRNALAKVMKQVLRDSLGGTGLSQERR